MTSIKIQKIVRDADGAIKSGSAAIIDTVYVSTGCKNHCTHHVREKLGSVLYLGEDRKSGIFLSPTKGLVQYSAENDAFDEVSSGDPRIRPGLVTSNTEIHTVSGDAYLLLEFLGKEGISGIL